VNANTNLERRLTEHYAGEPPMRAPDRVLLEALATIDTTKQRRGRFAPWRFAQMNMYAKVAAAVAVIAVVVVGFWQLAPRQPSSGGTVSPPPSIAPTTAPTASPTSTSITYVPPALTETFTSNLHGVAVSYPEGWTAQAATEPWTSPFPPQFGDPSGDLFYDPDRDDGHLFMAVGSRPLGGTALEDWLSDFMDAEGCTLGDPIVIDGADEAISTSCDLVLASSGDRGYVISLYSSNDDLDLRSFDTAAWFEEILATVQLQPEDAVD
jgi:hypothetical protein